MVYLYCRVLASSDLEKYTAMRLSILSILVVLLPFGAGAQNVKITKTEGSRKTIAKKVPEWAKSQNYNADAHVYFPDYYTFYDPVRGGYFYWDNNNFSFSPNVPTFLEKVDLAKSRIKILKGLSLDLHPEQNYPYYMKMYPPNDAGNVNVPVPVPGNPAH